MTAVGVSSVGTDGLDVIVGAGHNGLTAAAYLAQAGRSVLLLEASDRLGGLAVSDQVFPGVDARISRYSYLVSLLPQQVVTDIGLRVELRARCISSYTPASVDSARAAGLMVDTGDKRRTCASFTAVTGDGRAYDAWQRFYARTTRVAQALFPTMTEPLPDAAAVRGLVGADAWTALAERPLGEWVESAFDDDTVRGIVLTDALIGTFAAAGEASLLQNRCFLYHVIGRGTGAWDVPVGGMGAVSAELERAARRYGARIRTGCRVLSIDPANGEVCWVDDEGEHTVRAEHVLSAVAPHLLSGLLGEPGAEPPEGSQLKVNMVLSRLPRLRDGADPREAFAGTFHVNEGYGQLQRAYDEAAKGTVPTLPPCEVYCHTLTDRSILGEELREAGAHTMTLFGLHMPARLFRTDPSAARKAALAATLRSMNSVLAEPLEDCLLRAPRGEPCLEVHSPVDLEQHAGLPGGHIFHGDLSWPWLPQAHAARRTSAERWGVATAYERVLLAGAGAVRGGGVSGLGGQNAAMAILRGDS